MGLIFDRRCAFCRTQPAFHGKCTDPYGRKNECLCYVSNETHRYQWGQHEEGNYSDEADYDGGLGSRRFTDRREQEDARLDERILARD